MEIPVREPEPSTQRLDECRRARDNRRVTELDRDSRATPPLATRDLVKRTVLFTVIVFAAYAALAPFRDHIENTVAFAARHVGLPGVFLFVYVVDTLIMPASLDMLFPFAHRWNPILFLMLVSLASILGGCTGYWIGRGLNHWRYVRRATAAYHERGEQIIRKMGAWAIVLAGLTPIPYSTMSWIAGMLKLDFRLYAVASLSRVPRIVGYFYLAQAGLSILGPGA